MATTQSPCPSPSPPAQHVVLMGGDKEIEETSHEFCNTFEEMHLKDELRRGIYSYGFETPSLIQQKGILPIIRGRDLLAQAQSGTGKTAVYSIACLQKVDPSCPFTQALILAPFRELAWQTHNVISKMAKFMKGLNILRVVEGGAISVIARKVAEAPQHIIVGTPWRVAHMIYSEIIDVSHLRIFVLDEADLLLSQKFKDKIFDINSNLPKNAQTVLLSTTMPQEIIEVAHQILNDPVQILVPRDELTLDGLRQFYVAVEKEEFKEEALFDLYDSIQVAQCVIFCNSKCKVDYITEDLRSRKFTVSSIHDGMNYIDRDRIMQDFRDGKNRVLVTTDLLSRGIDIQQISLVVNYDLPMEKESYIRRVERSVRFGKKGIAINLVTEEDGQMLKDIQEFYGTKIEEMPANMKELLQLK
ncbi:putative eukaryotic initiation factor 4A [Monocercomonoides exilis]|uniref:putative eukaryotic initiation factor 4A n=1 Tax=Monocercomonoides exilis TaxID=2049356 RepID=UPI0035598831|nr:putative eukaryotic initiation factor 4A [Monocercomonoides exilis]|eukprot:MONOS_6735.1-p1 / transcript=MONOS_6735.1 / gene=MONOS_6735 / organism=Monocercomonoides_exilis_PA203 / gene_product=C. briggsae CBR-INF-1 protein / transcript_product=C. briggsae CBR-INF-1 protein / location=Mono_scaffold00217:77358-78775(-) / protein_length=414 / sequence_SO=supercontig / SO=protein_coding / is_pseudo=false